MTELSETSKLLIIRIRKRNSKSNEQNSSFKIKENIWEINWIQVLLRSEELMWE